MNEPYVSVGILSGKSITFDLTGIFSTQSDSVVTGRHTVMLSDSGLSFDWNGSKYTSLLFEPTTYDGDSFELEGVTIGVDFHWQRKENQRFRGTIRLVVDDGKIIAI
ncbi:MAG: amidase, partial [Duncaniella sp.]|nr:amidase [Duncaniella sp.]